MIRVSGPHTVDDQVEQAQRHVRDHACSVGRRLLQVTSSGRLLEPHRIGDDDAGFAALLHLLAAAGDSGEEPIPVAIETSRGLLVACLRATGRDVFAINPMAVSRYRDRHSVARKKSDTSWRHFLCAFRR